MVIDDPYHEKPSAQWFPVAALPRLGACHRTDDPTVAISRPSASASVAATMSQRRQSPRLSDLRASGAPGGGQIDLARALAAVAAARHWPFSIAFGLRGDVAVVDADKGVAVVRLVREAVTNAGRHAGPAAGEVRIELDVGQDVLKIEMHDDGCGAALLEFGNGLSGMRKRIEALGGTLALVARPGQGWMVSATIPRAGP